VSVLDGHVLAAAAPRVEAAGAVGAGDAFAGVLLAGLARGRTLEDVLEQAARAGAAAVTSAAAWPAV
jgi:sugar/nucleoside kinase (ribokinase family)